MTNTLHRRGAEEDLKKDYVIFVSMARGINREGSAPKIHEFLRICQRHNPINIGSSKWGSVLQDDVAFPDLIANLKDGATSAAVFTDLDTLREVMAELIEADLGISINVSGLLDHVQECCRGNGIERHSVEHSLGFWGSSDRLPERELLEFNTLCGHGLVSFNLIRKMIDYVKMRRLTPREAAKIMGKCCECAVFNTDRAERLLEKLLQT
ncbi:MAG: hypothetical protein JSV27_01925 [Candidatus Bathyarchaeota archaeon]|nr:MAG: hypothetical protein JSV27_01925 [Candidatus Bathyarchaeota archaeon]